MAETEVAKKLAEAKVAKRSRPNAISSWVHANFDDMLRQMQGLDGLTFADVAKIARDFGIVNEQGGLVTGAVVRKWFFREARERGVEIPKRWKWVR